MHIILSFLFIAAMFIMIPRAAVSMRRIGAVLDVEPGIKDPEEPAAMEQASDGQPEAGSAGQADGAEKERKGKARGTVEFRDVSFAFPDAAKNALEHISFTARPGQTTAIVGGTGSGKSTLLNLIPRFYDVTEGAVLLDGIDIRKMKLKDLRGQIGYVPQKGVLFSGTIASNIRFGDEEEVSQGGTNVSGGQKQRLSIARALIRKSPVYLFDDSFSALDFKTDRKLRQALKENTGESTFIIVAQRINTVMDADQIIVMDQGRIAGIGTHRQLLETCGIYREIAMSQLSEEELRKEGV